MLERQPHGSTSITGDDQRGDLDDLALSARRGPGLLLGAGDVAGGGDVIAATRSHHGEQGVFDSEGSHVSSVRRGADAGLTFR